MTAQVWLIQLCHCYIDGTELMGTKPSCQHCFSFFLSSSEGACLGSLRHLQCVLCRTWSS